MSTNKSIQLITARTAQPNTPETDRLEFVSHVVEIAYSDDMQEQITLEARCPQHAIDQVHQHNKGHYDAAR